MYKRLNKEDIASQTQLKTSAVRAIKTKISQHYPLLAETMDELLPKKGPIMQIKIHNDTTLIVVNGQPLFFNHFDGPYAPTLKLLHKYPGVMKQIQVDRGAIKFVLSGANIMCPGLTSPGGRLPEENIEKGEYVAVMAEGKEHPLAIGRLLMSTNEIKSSNKGHGVENMHQLGDALWELKSL